MRFVAGGRELYQTKGARGNMTKYMCNYGGCGRMVDEPHSYCELHRALGKQDDMRKADAKATRKPFAERVRGENDWMYHTPQYRKARAVVLARDGCCVLCGSTSSLTADHYPPAQPGCSLDDFCDPDRMRTLCRDCHNRISGSDGGKRKGCDIPQ